MFKLSWYMQTAAERVGSQTTVSKHVLDIKKQVLALKLC